jgi:hypothetical protein
LKRLGMVCLLLAAAGQAAEIPVMERLAPPATSVSVNCNAGETVQAAVDANRGPAEIVISGICVENVLIRNKDISLRGLDKQSLDGIRSKVAGTPALIVQGPVQAAINGLSFSNSVASPVSIRGANVTIDDCLFQNNTGSGLVVNAGGFVIASGLSFSGNTGFSINVSNAQFFCTGCDVSGNNFAVLANRGAIVSLLDSVVTGRRGLAVVDSGSFADIDCLSVDTPHPCSMQVTGVAAMAVGGGVAALTAAGDFTGQVGAYDRGAVYVVGARQIAGAQPGQGPPANIADFFGKIVAAALADVQPPIQSLLRGADAAHFGQILVTDDTIVKGAIQCSSAADAWLDPTVILIPGSTVSGCDHAADR